jgi:hypothetical protein
LPRFLDASAPSDRVAALKRCFHRRSERRKNSKGYKTAISVSAFSSVLHRYRYGETRLREFFSCALAVAARLQEDRKGHAPLAIRVCIKLRHATPILRAARPAAQAMRQEPRRALGSYPICLAFVARSKADSAWNTLRDAADTAPQCEFHRISVQFCTDCPHPLAAW